MRKVLLVSLFLLTGCANPGTGSYISVGDLQDFGPAPELTNEIWLNTEAPLRLSNLRGKVVLLEMWTFECINCLHVLPHIEGWYEAYADQGLVVIGNHFPEFPYEADLGHLKQAVLDLGIHYPVAQDNEGVTWNNYITDAWPTLYLIDKQGHIRYIYVGEGGYRDTENAIQTLLAENYP